MSRIDEATRLMAAGSAGAASDMLQAVIDAPVPGEDPFVASILRAQALVALGEPLAADVVYRSAAVAALGRPGGRLAAAKVQLQRAEVLWSTPGLRSDLVRDLEMALGAFQDAHDLDGFLQGLGVATRLHVLLGDGDVALDRAARLQKAGQGNGKPEVAQIAALYGGLAHEIRGEPTMAYRALTVAFRSADRRVKVQAASALVRVAARRGRSKDVSAFVTDLVALAGTEPDDVEAALAVRLPVDGGAALYPVLVGLVAVEPGVAAALCEAAAGWLRRCPRDQVGSVLTEAQDVLRGAGREDLARVLVTSAVGRLEPAEAALRLQAAWDGAPFWVRGVLAAVYAEHLIRSGDAAQGEILALSSAPILRERGFDADALACWLAGARAARNSGDLGGSAAPLEQAAAIAREGAESLWEALVALERAQQLRLGGRPHDALAVLPAAPWPAVASAVAVIRAGALRDMGRADEAQRVLSAVGASGSDAIDAAVALELSRGGTSTIGEA